MNKYTVAGVIIKQGERYLMVQEKLDKCYGQWNWPAGHADEGETPEEAAIREAKEETGLDVVLGRKLGEWHDDADGRTRVLYLAESFSGELAIRNSEILGAAWLDKEQMRGLRSSMRVADWTVDVVTEGGV